MASQEQIQLRLKKMLDLFDENPDGIKKDELCLRLGEISPKKTMP